MIKISFIVSLILIYREKFIFSTSFSFSNIHDIVEFSDQVLGIYRSVRTTKDSVYPVIDNSNRFIITESKSEIIRTISQQIAELTEELEYEMSSIFIKLEHGIPIAGDSKSVIREFYNCVIRIEELYRLYKEYTSVPPPLKYENYSVQNLIDTATSYKYGDLTDMLYHMWRLFVPTNLSVIKKGVLDYVITQHKVADPRLTCATFISFQHTLYEFFSSAVASEIKGFIMRAFSYGVLAGKFTSELRRAQAELILRSDEYLKTVAKAMKITDREVHRCDPEKHIWNDTYIDLEFLFQKILVNEIQVFPSQTCSLDCYQINSNKIHRCYSWSAISSRRRTYCPRRYCRGKMHRCSWVGSVTLCELPKNAHQRYEWIESENGRYGSYGNRCSGNKKRVNTSMSGFFNCDNCLCDCVEERADSEAIRTLSLRPQFSHISENKVLTGVRFLLKDNVIHLQIQESKLLKKGRIDLTHRRWVRLNRWVYMSNVSRGGFYILEDGEQEELENGVDYTFIRSDQRTLHLDDITAPYDHIITGVRLNHVHPPWPGATENNSPIHLEIYVTPYNYTEGTLNGTSDNMTSHWVTPETLYDPGEDYHRERTELKLFRPANPLKAPFNIPDSKPNQFVKFRTSDIWKDAGQSTIPFFDLQPIVSLREAVDCMGIFHKGAKGYGGFISLKICTLDISSHLEPLTEGEVELYKSFTSYRSDDSINVTHKII